MPDADSDTYPWVEDLDGIWHCRPQGCAWYTGSSDGGNADTICNQCVPSVRVSGFRPTAGDELFCGVCLDHDREIPA